MGFDRVFGYITANPLWAFGALVCVVGCAFLQLTGSFLNDFPMFNSLPPLNILLAVTSLLEDLAMVGDRCVHAAL